MTNIHEWFTFDAGLLKKNLPRTKHWSGISRILKQEVCPVPKRIFYKKIASREIEKLDSEIPFSYFDLRDYNKPLRNEDKRMTTNYIALFKLLSPEHLLNLPFINDSNSLDKRFYSELLHIIGRTETREGGKKLIGRNKERERHSGAILENNIIQLDRMDKVSRLEKPVNLGTSIQSAYSMLRWN